ncbi:MAG: lipoxygenase family protein [Kofleriaceae bacterium]
MAETFVTGRVYYPPGYWGAARPCRGVRVEILDKDLGNPDDVLWTGTTNGDGEFTAASDARWRDHVNARVRVPWPPPFYRDIEVDDPSDVKLLMARVTEGGHQHTFVPLAMTPNGKLLAPLVVPWAFAGAVQLPVTGVVRHALPPGAPVQFASVRIEDQDPGSSAPDAVFEGVTDLDGRFSGISRDVRSWLETAGDAPLLTVTISQGTHRQTFPATLALDHLAVAPLVVAWGPGAGAATPCQATALVRGLRALEIEARRALTRWGVRDGLAGCADPIPPWQAPTPRHTREYGAVVAESLAHAAEVRARWHTQPFDRLDDFRAFFPPFARPAVLDQYPNASDVVVSDQAFADQRLAGANPLMLRRINAKADLPRHFGGGFDGLRARCAPIADLGALLSSNQLFLVDYEILGDAPPTSGGKYLPSPLALFGVLHGRLAPLAIQIEQRFDATANPVVIPEPSGPRRGATAWQLAKVMVQIADTNAHELHAHLHDTHLAMEPFAVAMDRTMSRLHPVSLLMAPHFMGLVAKNSQARNYLLAPGIGPVQRLLGQTLEGCAAVLTRAAQRWSFPDLALPRWLHARGLDDTQALPEYPYRDDGLPIWNAIAAFTADYVSHTYASDAQLTTCDGELQRWLTEVRAADGGRLPSVPQVRSRAELSALLTQLIWTCSAQHSAVNFPQWSHMAYVPNLPGAAYARPLPSAQGPGEQRLERILPGADAALDQTTLMWQLAGYRYDKLGDYEQTFYEPWAGDVRRFQARLRELEAQQASADGARRIKYQALRPSQIINSINV